MVAAYENVHFLKSRYAVDCSKLLAAKAVVNRF